MGCRPSKQSSAPEKQEKSIREVASRPKKKQQQEGLLLDLREELVWERRGRRFEEVYEGLGYLGSGAMGTVQVVRKRRDANLSVGQNADNAHRYAAKVVVFEEKGRRPRRIFKERQAELRHEIDVLRRVDHPHIVHLREAFWEDTRLVLVMELCEGTALSSLAGTLEEPTVASVAAQLLRALAYLHARGIVHRDLKLDNVMATREDARVSAKLVDFGLSRRTLIEVWCVDQQWETKKVAVKAAGTLSTAAPEVVAGGPYSSSADVWSLGACVYKLVCCRDPFIIDGVEPIDPSIVRRLQAAQIPWDPATLWRAKSKPCREFVYNCMRAKAPTRWTADDALKFVTTDWLEDDSLREPEPALRTLYATLKRFASYSDLKRAALVVAAHHVDHRRTLDLRRTFEALDADDSGVVSANELRAALEHVTAPCEIDILFGRLDYDQSGSVHYHEFLAATIEDDLLDDEVLRDAFDRIDADDTGTITPANLRAILGRAATDDLVASMIADGDLRRDGVIDFDEFCSLMR
ncbi:hypothetical protein CTAYLR_006518 [Chrysophaeum taylorii]|uniref:Calmodulin n=1 Tax=Chrysophaeum taylorii TaxID=2483200 RepID=A0AAD7UFH4_9STRA|nr:hypothetical protein CTAYLR_006518 [Chrysophaeum taylorii]